MEVIALPTEPQPLPMSVAGLNKQDLGQKIQAIDVGHGMSLRENFLGEILNWCISV